LEKYVPAPSKGQILQDVLIGLKRFRNTVRWKWFWLEEARKKKRFRGKSAFIENEIEGGEKEEDIDDLATDIGTDVEGGLGTKLRKPNNADSAPYASKEVETFLDDVVETILHDFGGVEGPAETRKSKEIRRLEKVLGENRMTLVVPTDKTNSFKVVKKEDYLDWVQAHLDEAAIEVSVDRLQSIFDEAFDLLRDLDDFLSDNERGFIEESLKTRAIPTPKLLIKDHKEMDESGNYPTRLIVPASNFTAAFPKAGYLGIKTIFDKNRIEYQKSTIIHASQLKSKLERLHLRRGEVTIASFDAVEMYPSIKFRLVEKAVWYFAKDLDSDQRRKIEACLEMVRFGMGNTLVTFVDKYYEYGGEADVEEKGLTIGGYESAWLADLVASYLLENTVEVFNPAVFKGIYRDDGFVVFGNELSKVEVAMWLRKFQERVDELAESEFLKFTAVV
jgi:hypothetical protein